MKKIIKFGKSSMLVMWIYILSIVFEIMLLTVNITAPETFVGEQAPEELRHALELTAAASIPMYIILIIISVVPAVTIILSVIVRELRIEAALSPIFSLIMITFIRFSNMPANYTLMSTSDEDCRLSSKINTAQNIALDIKENELLTGRYKDFEFGSGFKVYRAEDEYERKNYYYVRITDDSLDGKIIDLPVSESDMNEMKSAAEQYRSDMCFIDLTYCKNSKIIKDWRIGGIAADIRFIDEDDAKEFYPYVEISVDSELVLHHPKNLDNRYGAMAWIVTYDGKVCKETDKSASDPDISTSAGHQYCDYPLKRGDKFVGSGRSGFHDRAGEYTVSLVKVFRQGDFIKYLPISNEITYTVKDGSEFAETPIKIKDLTENIESGEGKIIIECPDISETCDDFMNLYFTYTLDGKEKRLSVYKSGKTEIEKAYGKYEIFISAYDEKSGEYVRVSNTVAFERTDLEAERMAELRELMKSKLDEVQNYAASGDITGMRSVFVQEYLDREADTGLYRSDYSPHYQIKPYDMLDRSLEQMCSMFKGEFVSYESKNSSNGFASAFETDENALLDFSEITFTGKTGEKEVMLTGSRIIVTAEGKYSLELKYCSESSDPKHIGVFYLSLEDMNLGEKKFINYAISGHY